MADFDAEKTEPATPRRREEARQEGNVARSADLTAAAMLLAAILLLHWLGLQVLTGFKLVMSATLGGDLSANPTRSEDLVGVVSYGLYIAFKIGAPLLLGLTAVGLAVTVAQVGFKITPKSIMPDFARLSPLKGLKHIFDVRGRMRLVMSLGKVALVFGVAIWFVIGDLSRITTLSQLELLPAFGQACELVYLLALKLAALLLILAIFDYAYQFWQREHDLRMTKQEVKEEYRRMEGDPLIKQRRGRVARQLAMQRINSAVPGADVVVTNPTHYAVALKYDSQKMRAPKVVAKGADLLAARIRQLAALNEVPVIERRELAQALYRSVEVGEEVPPNLYNAVAEVLAYVYRLSGRKTA